MANSLKSSAAGTNWLRAGSWAVALSLGAAAGAYYVLKQQQRHIERWTPYDLPFPSALLDVLAAPGGGPLMQVGWQSPRLTAADTGRTFPVVDGIPDFGGQTHPNTLELTPWYDLYRTAETVFRYTLPTRAIPVQWLAEHTSWHARQQWCLVTPVTTPAITRLARAYPTTRFLCLDDHWPRLLEARRQTLIQHLPNVYFVHAAPGRLPLRTGSITAAFSHPSRASTPPAIAELHRTLRAGGVLAGVAHNAAAAETALETLPLAHYQPFQSGNTLGFLAHLP